ncbi:PH domain-containing protein [Aliidiomarina sp. Khilg15.8]
MKFDRVSPLTLLYFFGRSIVMLLRQGTNLLPAAVAIVAVGEQIRAVLFIVLPIAIPALLVLHAAASWWCFRYAVNGKTLYIRDGIFKRKQLTLEFARIQQADVRQPWYFRPMKLAILGVDSAGSKSKEVELAGLPVAAAERLKASMLAESEQSSTHASGSSPSSDTDSRFEMQLPLSEVARYGLMYNPILLLIPILAYPLSQLNLFETWIEPRLEGWLRDYQSANGDESLWWLLAAAVLGAIVLTVLASIVIAIIRFYRFHLQVTDSGYHSQAGLFSITSRGFQYVRLQRVILQQGILARLLKRFSLRINQSGQPNQQQGLKTFFVPVLNAERQRQLGEQLGLSTPAWRGMHPLSMLVPWVSAVAVVATATYLISGFEWYWTLHSFWVSAIVAGLVQLASWRRRAVFLDSDWFATRRGMIGQQQRWVPVHKVQTITLKQGPWLRLFGSASLHVYSAAGRESIRWLPYDDLLHYREALLNASKHFHGRWM